MRCPVCEAEGQTSTVRSMGCARTLMGGGGRYWDEADREHYHDPNSTNEGFMCSQGHRWSVKSRHPCGACDYGHEEPTVTVYG